jgi:hypothetical protein
MVDARVRRSEAWLAVEQPPNGVAMDAESLDEVSDSTSGFVRFGELNHFGEGAPYLQLPSLWLGHAAGCSAGSLL